MTNKISKVIVFSIVFLVFQISTLACVRIGVPPIRVQYQEADIVFIGKVNKVIKVKSKDDDADFYKITFELKKNYKGVNSTKVDIFMRDDSCSYKVDTGESWIVFAYFNKNIKKYQIVERILLEKENEDLLELLDKASTNKFPSGIKIEIGDAINSYDRYDYSVKADLIRENFKNSYQSDSGIFEIEGIEPGKYKIRFTFDRQVSYVYFNDQEFKIISEKPTIIETEIEVAKNELSFLYFEAMKSSTSEKDQR